MDIMEIVLLAAGGIVFVLSFLIPMKKEEDKEETRGLAKEEIKALVSEELEAVRGHVDDVVEEAVTYSIEKTERSLERLSNEKIMAVNEYSDTVLAEIHKNHEEVMFLYDMLNDKHINLKNTVSEVNRTVKEVKETKKEAEEVVNTFQRLAPEAVIPLKAPVPAMTPQVFATAPQESVVSGVLPEPVPTKAPVTVPPVFAAAPIAAQGMEPQVSMAVQSPEGQKASPVSRSTVTIPQKVPMAVQQVSPAVQQVSPAPRQTKPVPQQVAAVPRQVQPVPQQVAAGTRQTTPTLSQASPVPRKVTPASRQDSPTPQKVAFSASKRRNAPQTVAVSNRELPPSILGTASEATQTPVMPQSPVAAQTPVMPQSPVTAQTPVMPQSPVTAQVPVVPQFSAAPQPFVPRTSPAEPLQGSGSPQTSGVINFARETDGQGRNYNDRVLELYKSGKSNVAIARELNLGVGEVKLVIDLYKNRSEK